MTWRPITPEDAGKKMLVTNNIDARDALGEMSHVWIGYVLKTDMYDGPWVTFDQGDRRISRLTHCCPIPMEIRS